MNEIKYFTDSGNPEISVALAGIHKQNWVSSKESESIDAAVLKMLGNRFDVLPIENANGIIDKCYKTDKWGVYHSSNISIHNITKEHTIYYLTNIHDAIKKFALTDRKFFFLHNEDEIIGLITIGNLNCKHVYLYLYNLIIQLEHAMGAYIYNNGYNDLKLIQLFEERPESGNAKDALRRYKDDDALGFDYNFVEYIYLTDLAYIFKKTKLIDRIEITRKHFLEIIGLVNDIRVVVAHPNKSLIKDETSLKNLYEAITGIDRLLTLLERP